MSRRLKQRDAYFQKKKKVNEYDFHRCVFANNSVNCKQWNGKISNEISLHFRIIAQWAAQCKRNDCAVFGCEREARRE